MSLKNIFFYSFIIIFLNSCGDKHDFELYVKDIDIDFVDEYKIDSIQQFGFSDWTLQSYIQISENDKKRILENLKRKTTFVKAESRNKYLDEYYNNNDSIFGYILNSKYNYEITIGRYDSGGKSGYEKYKVEIDTINNKLFFEYGYE